MQCTKLKTYMETGRVIFLPPRSIRPNPAQPRTVFHQESLEELAASIRIHGILQPLSVRRVDSCFQLIAGERRYRAAQMAGLREIPCIVMRMDDAESGLTALLENLQRQDLNFVEEAQAFSQMMSRFSMSQEQVAKAVGKSQSAVANKLRLLRHSQPVLHKLLEHDLTERHARALLKLPSDPQKLSAIAHIARNHLTVSQTERYIEGLVGGDDHIAPQSPLLEERVARRSRDGCGVIAPHPSPAVTASFQGEAFLSQLQELLQATNLPITLHRADSPTHITLTLTIPKP